MKKISIFVLSFFIFSFMGGESYAFLVNKTTNENNIVATGTFPKFNIRLYSASGPVFKESLPGQQNQQSLSYPMWFNDASKYIVKDIAGQDLNLPASKNEYETLVNIANNSTGINRKNTIISPNFYSWQGQVLDKYKDQSCKTKDIKEHGTTIHNIVAIENSNRLGQQSPKIKLDDLKLDNITISINQYDVFKGLKGEYTVQRQNEAFNPGTPQNSTRIRTFNLINGKYVRTFKNKSGQISYDNQSSNGVQPAPEADLILFDVGGEGYYSEPGEKGKLTEQQILDQLYERLCGTRPHADLIKDKYDICYQKSSPMYNTVLNMIENDDLKCSLDRSVCEVKLIRDNVSISDNINTIFYGN